MSVAVLSALQSELDLLIESLEDSVEYRVAGWPIWTGRIGSIDVTLARAGLGKVNTAALSAIVWERHRPALMLFTGVAGGIDPAMSVGDLVVGERTIQHDAGVLSPDGLRRYQAGHIPFFNPTDRFGFTPSPGLLAIVRELCPNVELAPVLGRSPEVVFGTILTGDIFLEDEKSRSLLFSDLAAQAVEMEGAALGQTASRFGIDHLVIRSVSDLAGGGAVEYFDRFLSEVSANSARMVLALLDRLQEDDRDHPVGP